MYSYRKRWKNYIKIARSFFMKRFFKYASFLLMLSLLLSLVSCRDKGESYTLRLGSYRVEGGVAYAALLTDAEDKIILARIDEIELSGDPVSKKAMGDSYGMEAAGAIGEWYEQVAYLERALIGRSYDEAIELKTGDTALVAGCTIAVEGLISAVGAAFLDEGVTVMGDNPVIALTLGALSSGDGYIVSGGAAVLYRGYTLGQRTEIRRNEKGA